MKKNIHPNYHMIKVVMTAGSEFETMATWGIENDVIKLIEEGPKELLDQTSITQPVLLLCSYLHYHEIKQKLNLIQLSLKKLFLKLQL